jgi:hypothetical protein
LQNNVNFQNVGKESPKPFRIRRLLGKMDSFRVIASVLKLWLLFRTRTELQGYQEMNFLSGLIAVL